MVAADALEQLDTPAFYLVAADGAENCRPSCGQVVVEEGIAEVAHVQSWDADVAPNDVACHRERNRGMQLVRLAAQPLQLPAGAGQIAGLVEQLVAERQHLVGSYDERG